MTKELKTSPAQRAAVERYKKRNPDKTRITSYRETARMFVRHHATREEMEELMKIFEKENPNASGHRE